jgi:alkylhydroperoxidase family enzyme
LRQQSKLLGRCRELAILWVAIVNGADYEYKSHVPFGLKESLTQKQIDALPNWQTSDAFNAAERAVLAYADSMTKEIQVPDSKFEPLRPHFDARELTELTATIAAYNLVSRFLEAVQIDHEPEQV